MIYDDKVKQQKNKQLLDMRKNIIEGKHTKMLIVALFVIFLATAIIFKVFSIEIFPSQFYGAMIGVVITALITMLLLEGQTASEKQRNKDVKVFEQQVRIFSEFTKKMWSIIDDDKDFSNREILELKNICFQELIFQLKKNEIDEITEQMKKIDVERGNIAKLFSKITEILKNALNSENEKDNNNESSDSILELSDAFNDLQNKWDALVGEKIENKLPVETKKAIKSIKLNETNIKGIQFWHFNMLNDSQIEAFKIGNWTLALVEWGETWRTNLLKQVKYGDVVFLFRRGGNGYIGAFRVLGNKILEREKNTYEDEETQQFDIYNGMKDGASLSSNLLVQPIAYNYKGIGYYSVRRRTIERMNDLDSVKFLLNRFNGNDLPESFIDGKDKLDVNTSIKKEDIDFKYFEKLIKEDTSGQ